VQPSKQDHIKGEMPAPLFQFHRAGAVGAAMRPGRGGPQGEDAVFMDLQKGVFAVADGAGRASGASRRLMAGFGDALAHVDGMDWALVHPDSDLQSILARFRKTVESMLGNIPYGDATTFTALKVLRCGSGIMGILCHCGDSLIFQFDPETGLRQITQTNFWLAGRTPKVYQAESFFAPAGTVFLLTTDGISDFRFPGPFGISACLTHAIRNTPVDQIPKELLAEYDQSLQPVDDIALIAVSPEHFEPSETQIFIDIQGVRQQGNYLAASA
jgi:hypothetical protein